MAEMDSIKALTCLVSTSALGLGVGLASHAEGFGLFASIVAGFLTFWIVGLLYDIRNKLWYG
jgi:hypothetical protein